MIFALYNSSIGIDFLGNWHDIHHVSQYKIRNAKLRFYYCHHKDRLHDFVTNLVAIKLSTCAYLYLAVPCIYP